MSEILLVHGACHGAWCWRDVIPLLEARGHRVRAIDLPSHGDDPTPLGDVTLDAYARAILDALEGPTVVVGHSMAGYPISVAADMDASRIARLVYLCAYVPKAGYSLVEMRKLAARQPILKALLRSEDGTSFSVIPEHAREVFYHDCPDEAVDYALERLCPQAVAPQAMPVTLGETWAGVPRSYIVCEDDNAVPVELQRDMARDFPDVRSLPGSHSPFFAQPDALADLIHDIAQEA